MKKIFGYFDDAQREYVITDPKTPWPWINYLGNEDFFSLISNTAGGYTFCTAITMSRWTTAEGISTSMTTEPYGHLDGSHARHRLISMNVVMA